MGARQGERGLWERDDIMLITSLCDCEEERPRGRERFNLEWLDGAVTRKQAQEYQTEHRAHGPSPGDGTNRDAKSACKEFEAAIRKEQEQGRKRKAEEMEAKEELALQSAATDVVVKTVAKLRIRSKRPDPKCRSTCHDGWHDDNCPNNPRSKGIAAEALVRRAHSAGRAVREAWGPTEEAKLFQAMGLQQPSPAPAPLHFSGVGPDILGGRMKSCPEAVHEQMLLQAAHSRIQITSLEQRSKCFLDKVPCHVPPSFQQALRWCYVHPKLPPPPGTKWWNTQACGSWRCVASRLARGQLGLGLGLRVRVQRTASGPCCERSASCKGQCRAGKGPATYVGLRVRVQRTASGPYCERGAARALRAGFCAVGLRARLLGTQALLARRSDLPSPALPLPSLPALPCRERNKGYVMHKTSHPNSS